MKDKIKDKFKHKEQPQEVQPGDKPEKVTISNHNQVGNIAEMETK